MEFSKGGEPTSWDKLALSAFSSFRGLCLNSIYSSVASGWDSAPDVTNWRDCLVGPRGPWWQKRHCRAPGLPCVSSAPSRRPPGAPGACLQPRALAAPWLPAVSPTLLLPARLARACQGPPPPQSGMQGVPCHLGPLQVPFVVPKDQQLWRGLAAVILPSTVMSAFTGVQGHLKTVCHCHRPWIGLFCYCNF